MSKRLIALSLLFALTPVAQAQTCNIATIPTTPTERFADNSDGTVTDLVTGLTWKRCAEGMTWSGTACTGSAAYYTWRNALQRAAAVNSGGGYAGHADWRVPDSKELASIVERQCVSPSVNLTIFPNTPSSFFWSASPVAGNSDYAWGVGFYYGDDVWGFRVFADDVRLVRAGQ